MYDSPRTRVVFLAFMGSCLAMAVAMSAAPIWSLTAGLWPYFDAGPIFVKDSEDGADVELRFDGGPRLPFIGSYSVMVREVDTEAIVVESHSSRFEYVPGTRRPDPLTLGWWAYPDARALDLPAGSYTMRTCWTIYNALAGIFGPLTQCVQSNQFSVKR